MSRNPLKVFTAAAFALSLLADAPARAGAALLARLALGNGSLPHNRYRQNSANKLFPGVERAACASVSGTFCSRLNQNTHLARKGLETLVANRPSNQLVVTLHLVIDVCV